MWYAVIFIAVLLLDQITKILVAAYSGAAGFAGGSSIHLFWVIKDFFEVAYCENENGSMGLFGGIPNIQIIFKVSTIVIIGAIIIYLFVSKNRTKWLNVTISLILSGAIGNFIDRMTFTYVRDFIHIIIPWVNGGELFPYIFNVADIALVVGSIMLIIHLLFLDKDALFRVKKKDNSNDEPVDDKTKIKETDNLPNVLTDDTEKAEEQVDNKKCKKNKKNENAKSNKIKTDKELLDEKDGVEDAKA